MLSKPKLEELDEVLWEWYKSKRSEGRGISMADWMLIDKAKDFHKNMDISEPCSFSYGWLRSFRETW